MYQYRKQIKRDLPHNRPDMMEKIGLPSFRRPEVVASASMCARTGKSCRTNDQARWALMLVLKALPES